MFFPSGKAGNIVRGAFGVLLRKLTCVPECTDARTCPRRFSCPYARMFEPHAIGHGPSGFADPPRPFVFRAAHLDGCRVPAGSRFHFDVHVFDVRNPAPQYFALAFAQLAREGLGPGRGRAELLRVEQLGRDRQPAAVVFQGAGFADPDLAPPIVIGLRPAPKPVRRVRIRFLTPTELKAAGELALRPEFAILFARIRDRLSALRTFYGAGPLAMDFRGMGQRAGRVALGRTALRWSETSRRSGRTGQQHPFGGFTGEVEYEGELAEFLPFLEAAQWTGVGRQAVWGKGEISVAVAA